MAQVQFTSNLNPFFPDLKTIQIEAKTVMELISAIEKEFSGITSYLCNEQGGLRKHVNIFVNSEMIVDREKLSDKLSAASEVFIVQALSGG